MEPKRRWLERKVSARQTHGALSVFQGMIPPGMVVDPHVHTGEDECTHVLSGELVFQIGERQLIGRAGDYVVKPRGVRHAFWNASTQPAEVEEIITPGSLDEYFPALGRIFATEVGAARLDAANALQAQHGIATDWDAGERLRAKLKGA